ncbi:hypothetical protein ACFSRY_15930 [Pontibacter locisalis]|uniref:SpoIIAA-like n=1 Tax=Pontibacter locisalis TaxID=1719035 RepID=A0ABW5IPY9_9BACT
MENSPLLITYGIDPEHKLLYSKWKGPFTSSQYREGLLHVAEAIHNNQIKLWLHESLRLEEIDMQDQKWTTEVFALILAQSPLKHLAIVRPEKQQSRTIASMLREKAYRIFGKIIGVEFFGSVEEAKAWLVPKRLYYTLPSFGDSSQKVD